jgi:zinc protease
MDLLAQILGGGSTSRLYRALVVDQQAAASASAWYESSGYDSSRFGVHATPRGEVTLADLEQRIDAVIAEVIAGGVTEEELQRAKTQMIAEAVYAQDSQATLARVFGSALATGQSVADVQDWPNRIAKVTAADVQAAAAKFLEAKRSVTGYLAQPLPDEAGAVAATPRQDDGKS